jgi:hypothetical protein
MARTPKATATIRKPAEKKPTPGTVLADALLDMGKQLDQIRQLLTLQCEQNDQQHTERRDWQIQALSQNREHMANYTSNGKRIEIGLWFHNLVRFLTLVALLVIAFELSPWG